MIVAVASHLFTERSRVKRSPVYPHESQSSNLDESHSIQ